jgi:transcription initiation factor TFIIH subunit 1
VMTSEDACRALGDLSPGGVLLPVQHATGTCYIAGNSLEDLVKRQHHALTELLRHFWMCFPTTTKFLEEKATRMATCLASFRDSNMVEFRAQLPPEHQQVPTPTFLATWEST